MKKNQQGFIEKNMYTGKSSKSVYKYLIQSAWVNLIILIGGLVIGHEINKFEEGKDFIIPGFVAFLYDTLGKFNLTIFWISIMLFFFGLAFYQTRKLIELKNKYKS